MTASGLTLGVTGQVGTGVQITSNNGGWAKITGAAWMDVVNWTVQGWSNRGTTTLGRIFTREARPGQAVNPDYVWSLQYDSTGKPQAVVFRSGSASVITAGSALT